MECVHARYDAASEPGVNECNDERHGRVREGTRSLRRYTAALTKIVQSRFDSLARASNGTVGARDPSYQHLPRRARCRGSRRRRRGNRSGFALRCVRARTRRVRIPRASRGATARARPARKWNPSSERDPPRRVTPAPPTATFADVPAPLDRRCFPSSRRSAARARSACSSAAVRSPALPASGAPPPLRRANLSRATAASISIPLARVRRPAAARRAAGPRRAAESRAAAAFDDDGRTRAAFARTSKPAPRARDPAIDVALTDRSVHLLAPPPLSRTPSELSKTRGRTSAFPRTRSA